MKKYFLILFFFTSFLTLSHRVSWAEQDSLLTVLNEQKGEDRMKTLSMLVKEYMNNSVEDVIIYANELLMLSEESGELKYMDFASSYLGEAYFYLDNIDKSIEYFEKFLEINILQEDVDGIGTAYNNLGIVYRYIEKYETSIQYYLESLEIKESLNDSVGVSNTLNNIGVLYFHMKEYNQALKYYSKSYNIEKASNNNLGIATSLLNIAEVEGYLNNYNKALNHFKQSLEIAEQIEDKYTMEVNYKCLYEMYKRKVNFQKALYYYELYTEFRNVRLSQESKSEIAELEVQYETNKKEKEIELLNKQNELNRRIILILSIAFLIFIFLIAVLYRQGKAKKIAFSQLSIKNQKITEQSETLDKLNTTKDKFFSIISHDLKGSIGGFLSQSEFLAEYFKDLSPNDMHDLIKKMNQSSKQLYLLLENLLEWSRSQTGSLKQNPEKFNLNELLNKVLPIYNEKITEKKLKTKIKIDPQINVFADINMISTVFRNLISNAIKFSNNNSTITISALKISDLVEIKVSDEGIGIAEKDQEKLFKIDQSFSNPGTKKEKGTGLGLLICKEFIEQNGGTLNVESEYGKRSTFNFTLKKA